MKNANKPAFSLPAVFSENSNNSRFTHEGAAGLTKREYIATHLTAGAVAAAIPGLAMDELLNYSVELTDMLLAKLAETKNQEN